MSWRFLSLSRTRPKTKKVLTENRVQEFKTIFHEILDIELFADDKEKTIDVINALIFGIFYKFKGKRVGHEGLRAVLKWRKDRSLC